MVAYLSFSVSGTVGLLLATLTFWSQRPLFNKIGLFSNFETLIFASTLAIGFLFDKHRDYSPMIVGVSRSMSIAISSVAWFVIPVGTSAIGSTVSLLRTKALRKSEVTPWPR
jgi:hypothetical protein